MNHAVKAARSLLAAALLFSYLPAPAAHAASGQITLNFVNADINAVIKAMSEMTGKTFVVDPRVKGTLNITSPRPVRRDVAYDILLSSLRMQGYAAVQVGGVVRIVPEADAKFYATPTTGKTRRKQVGGEMVTRVFPLRHESATQLQAALRPMVGVNSAITAEPGSNTLVVTDYADNLTRLEQVIRSLDVPTADEPVVIPLKYASAHAVAGLVTRVFAPSQTAGGTSLDALQVGVDERSNSIIVRGRDRSLLSKVQNLAASMDAPTPAAGNVHVIYLKNAQATEIAKTLRNIVSADSSPLTQSQAQPLSPASQTASAGQSQPAGQSQQASLSGRAPAAPDSGPGMIQADAANNALIITAPEAIFNNLRAVVEKLDVRRAQVLVEALIVEVSADKAAEFGIQWFGATSTNRLARDSALGGMFGNSNTAPGGTNIGLVGSDLPTSAIGVASGFNIGLFKTGSLGVLARALETEAGANILSTPTLLTLDNEEAKISVGSNVPFATGSYTTPNIATGGSVSPFTTYERQDVGLTLKVRPQISESGTVRMQISQEVSQLRQQSGTDTTLASTDKRSIDSSVLVDDGQTIVLGGLIQNQMTEGKDSVPILGDIPVLGNLFKYNTRNQTKTNLMVFIRPQIVRTSAQASAVTSPRYDYILGEQYASSPAHHPMLPDLKPPLLGSPLQPETRKVPAPGDAAPAPRAPDTKAPARQNWEQDAFWWRSGN